MYCYGLGAPQDVSQAMVWYLKATDQDRAKAQYIVDLMYHSCVGASKDYSKGMERFHKAADQGQKRRDALWLILISVDEVSLRISLELWNDTEKQRYQGHKEGVCQIGNHYYTGRGVPWDRLVAVEWYRKAAKLGYIRSKAMMDKLLSPL